MTKFKKLKGVTEEMRKVIFFDLMCLKMEETEDNKYHYKLLKDNLIDLLGYPKEN